MLRAEVRAGAALGEAAKSSMASGGLVCDELINQMLDRRVRQPDCAGGFLLDGYPRTTEQAEFLDGVLRNLQMNPPVLLHFDVPTDALVGRMASRRQCPKCSRIYNLLSAPPKSADTCDDDGTKLITRKDDREHVIRERLNVYNEATRPVLAHYEYQNYYQIRGDRSPGYVFEEITGILEPMLSQNGDRHTD